VKIQEGQKGSNDGLSHQSQGSRKGRGEEERGDGLRRSCNKNYMVQLRGEKELTKQSNGCGIINHTDGALPKTLGGRTT